MACSCCGTTCKCISHDNVVSGYPGPYSVWVNTPYPEPFYLGTWGTDSRDGHRYFTDARPNNAIYYNRGTGHFHTRKGYAPQLSDDGSYTIQFGNGSRYNNPRNKYFKIQYKIEDNQTTRTCDFLFRKKIGEYTQYAQPPTVEGDWSEWIVIDSKNFGTLVQREHTVTIGAEHFDDNKTVEFYFTCSPPIMSEAACTVWEFVNPPPFFTQTKITFPLNPCLIFGQQRVIHTLDALGCATNQIIKMDTNLQDLLMITPQQFPMGNLSEGLFLYFFEHSQLRNLKDTFNHAAICKLSNVQKDLYVNNLFAGSADNFDGFPGKLASLRLYKVNDYFLDARRLTDKTSFFPGTWYYPNSDIYKNYGCTTGKRYTSEEEKLALGGIKVTINSGTQGPQGPQC